MTFQDHPVTFRVQTCPAYCSVPNYQSLFILNMEENVLMKMCNAMKF